MKRTRHAAEQIIRKLQPKASAKQQTAEQLIAQGKTVTDVCRVIEVTQPTDYRWRQQSGGMKAEEARRLTQLEKQNASLQPKASPKEWRLQAKVELEKVMLQPQARRSGRTLERETSEPDTSQRCKVHLAVHAHPQGPHTCLPPPAAGGLEHPSQTGATDLAGRGAAAAHRRVGTPPPGRASPPGVGHGLPVRRHR